MAVLQFPNPFVRQAGRQAMIYPFSSSSSYDDDDDGTSAKQRHSNPCL
jgi:hypothetical protein